MHDITRTAKGDHFAYNQNRGLPWHGLGQSITVAEGEKITGSHILTEAHLDWTVLSGPVSATITDDLGLQHTIEIPGRQGLFRSDTLGPLGDVGAWYKPLDNEVLTDFAEILGHELGVDFDTAGDLAGGRIVFLSFKFPTGITVGGDDPIELWGLLADYKDGSGSLRVDTVKNRVVCRNTLQMAHGSAVGTVKIRHTGDLERKIEQARGLLAIVNTEAAEWAKQAEQLLSTSFEIEEFEKFLAEAVLVDATGDPKEKRTQTRQLQVEADRAAVKSHLLHSPTLADDVRLTKWGAFNAVTEWAEHGRDLRPDKRVSKAEHKLLATWSGPIAGIRDSAWKALTAV